MGFDQVLTVKVNDGAAWPLIDRLYWDDATLLTTATTGTNGVVDISLSVYDEDGPDPVTPVYTSTLAVATTLFATLQTDGYLALMPDAIGYNMRYLMLPTLFEAQGGKLYRVELKFNPHASNVYGQKTWARRFDVQVMVTV